MKTKQSAFTSKRKKKPAKRTILQVRPLHRLFPKGRTLDWRASSNLFLRTTGFGKVSLASIKAFRKALLSKRLRRLFIFRATPYLDLTKKPNEVRMGKGHGTKIQDTIFPFNPGQVLVEVNLDRRIRLTARAKVAMQVATRKFPFRVIISKMDI